MKTGTSIFHWGEDLRTKRFGEVFYCHADLGWERGLNFPYCFIKAKALLDPLSEWKDIFIQKMDIFACVGFFFFFGNILKWIYFCSNVKQKTFGKYSPHFVVVTLKVLTNGIVVVWLTVICWNSEIIPDNCTPLFLFYAHLFSYSSNMCFIL